MCGSCTEERRTGAEWLRPWRREGGTSGNRVISNWIGTGWAGVGSTPNGVGISAHWGNAEDTIGGPGEGNLISGNAGPGTYIENASGLEVLSNFIGTGAGGTGSRSNGGSGVELAGCAQNNTI